MFFRMRLTYGLVLSCEILLVLQSVLFSAYTVFIALFLAIHFCIVTLELHVY